MCIELQFPWVGAGNEIKYHACIYYYMIYYYYYYILFSIYFRKVETLKIMRLFPPTIH